MEILNLNPGVKAELFAGERIKLTFSDVTLGDSFEGLNKGSIKIM